MRWWTLVRVNTVIPVYSVSFFISPYYKRKVSLPCVHSIRSRLSTVNNKITVQSALSQQRLLLLKI